ncbi:hypothetical protein [Bacillus pseudomycoides]|uniref:hypothetical protein n=1 Tax=Bacillus pseudomycoides TaxID=64104 RepID=UPI0015968ADF|nr:hypothetical protein [Bacillus pseudomycoides]
MKWIHTKTRLFSFLAALCFSIGLSCNSMIENAVTTGVLFGVICLLIAVFLTDKQNID